MQILKPGAELTAAGIPLEDLLKILGKMRGNVEKVANDLAKLVSNHILGEYDEGNIPSKEELPQIAALVWRLRPLAESAVLSGLARGMESSANEILTDKLEQIMRHI